jgi:hypothetical protein
MLNLRFVWSSSRWGSLISPFPMMSPSYRRVSNSIRSQSDIVLTLPVATHYYAFGRLFVYPKGATGVILGLH